MTKLHTWQFNCKGGSRVTLQFDTKLTVDEMKDRVCNMFSINDERACVFTEDVESFWYMFEMEKL